jgi:hypothetical protein
LYSYASGSAARAAEFRWSAADGVTLTVFDPEWGAIAERYMAEGIASHAMRRPVLPLDGENFMRTLVQPSQSTYVRFVDESTGPEVPAETGADSGGLSPLDAYRVLAGLPVGGADPGASSALPARTRDEAQLYMDLHPCEVCGSVNVPWKSGTVFVDGIVARAYVGTCAGCGQERRFVFESPDPASAPPLTGLVTFGGRQPSRVVDAGEWLWVADLTASRVPTNNPARARYALSVAVAAMEEILKFLPPDAERVPAEAFWSERGRQVWTAEPGRFEAERLVIVRDVYTERLAALADNPTDDGPGSGSGSGSG